MTLPTNDQVGAILGAADERFRALMALAAFAGLRLGEAAGLQVGDVDYLRRVLLVRRQVQRAPGGAVEIRALSTAASGLCSCPTSCSSC